MAELDKNELPQGVFDLYDDYAHQRIERREFLERLSGYAVGGLTLPALLGFILPDYQRQQIKSNDPRLVTEYITYPSPNGGKTIKAQLSRPADHRGKLPGIIVVHENRGLNPHIEDVGRRAALAGYISLAPDMLTPLGGYPGNDDEGRNLQSKRDRNEMLTDFIAGFDYLRDHKKCTGNIGVVGFCFGGWIANMMAVKVPDLKAAVPYYGGQPVATDVPAIKAALLLHYGELDTRVNEGWPAYEAALKANGKEYQAFIYPGANHGFHNDTTPRYDKAAAELSWQRTLEFFKSKLG